MANVFKTLGSLIWGNKTNPNLIEIPSGQFYVYDPAGSRTCIYIDARATIRRTTQPYLYTLAVQRIFEEGEEGLENTDENSLDDERVFMIDKDISFQKDVVSGATAFSWYNLNPEENGYTYEFICDDDTTVYTANSFEITIYQCMYQRKHQKSHFNADEQEFREFEVRTPRSRSVSFKSAGTRSHDQRRGTPSSSGRANLVKSEPGLRMSLPSLPQFIEQHACLAEARGILGLFESRTGLFNDAAEGFIRIVRTRGEDYWIVVVDNGERQLLAQPFSRDMSPVFTPTKLSLIWVYLHNGESHTWIFRFPDVNSLNNIQLLFGEGMVETFRRADAAEAQRQQRGLALEREQARVKAAVRAGPAVSTTRGPVKYEESSDEEQGPESEEEMRDEDEVEGSEDEDFMISSGSKQDGQKNSLLAVGAKERSFVVRGSKVGVFSHDGEDGHLKFETTITNLNNSRGRTVKPSHILLHDADTSMMILDDNNGDTAYKMDLEYGKIVEEWSLPGTTGVTNLLQSSKYPQHTNPQTLIGHSKDALFRIDPRLANSKIVPSEFKQYAKSNHFTCGTTTTNGSLAVAGFKGDIKLFGTEGVGKIARTAIPGLGDPIIGIDVTGDGQFVLATCATYLLVFDVLNPANKAFGYDKSFPADSKPTPIKLTLRPEHVAAMRHQVNFTPARFNTGFNEREKTIVTSTGPYVITWNFRRVKLGNKDYQIKQYSDNVVADNFKYGQDRSIIVALPHDVTSVQKKNMVNSTEAF